MTQLATIQEYAQLRGCSRQAVEKAAAKGRITLIDSPRGRLVDVDAANEQWSARTDPAQQQRGAPAQFAKTQTLARDSAAKSEKAADGDSPESVARARNVAAGLSLVEEKTRAERIRIEKAEIELALMRGDLVNRDAWTRAHGAKLAEARELFLAIPDRLSGLLAAESNPNVCHQLIRDEIHHCMTVLSTPPKNLPPRPTNRTDH